MIGATTDQGLLRNLERVGAAGTVGSGVNEEEIDASGIVFLLGGKGRTGWDCLIFGAEVVPELLVQGMGLRSQAPSTTQLGINARARSVVPVMPVRSNLTLFPAWSFTL